MPSGRRRSRPGPIPRLGRPPFVLRRRRCALAALPDADLDEFLDLAELRTLETVHSHLLDLVDTAAGQRHDEYSQLANGLQLKIDRLGLRLRQVYGWTATTAEAGIYTAAFAEHFET